MKKNKEVFNELILIVAAMGESMPNRISDIRLIELYLDSSIERNNSPEIKRGIDKLINICVQDEQFELCSDLLNIKNVI